MPMQIENEKLIKRFIFGEMPEEERFEFEERFITDADLFEQIKISEDELIEKYVRGWMDSAEYFAFEKNFLKTKIRRERVEFSRQLISKIQQQKGEIIHVKKNNGMIAEESFWQRFGGSFLTPQVATVTAFTVLVAVFGSWFLYQSSVSKETEFVKIQNLNTTEIPGEMVSPTPEIPSAESIQSSENENSESIQKVKNNSAKQTNNSNTEPDEIPVRKPTPKNQKDEINNTSVPPPTPPIQKSAPNPVLTLFTGTVRSGGKNNVLNLPENAKGATLQLNLESIDYKNYQAELNNADGKVIFRKGEIKAEKSKINLFIPAANLTKGDYMLKLYGINASGENESVADFQFRVNR